MNAVRDDGFFNTMACAASATRTALGIPQLLEAVRPDLHVETIDADTNGLLDLFQIGRVQKALDDPGRRHVQGVPVSYLFWRHLYQRLQRSPPGVYGGGEEKEGGITNALTLKARF